MSRLIRNIEHIPLEAEKPLMVYPIIYAKELIVGILNILMEFHHFKNHKTEFYLFIKNGSPVGVYSLKNDAIDKIYLYWLKLRL